MSPIVGLQIVGLEAYTPAPQPAEPPEWLATTGELWTRVDGRCLPVRTASVGFELDTCVEDTVTCGVAGTAAGLLTMSNSWCRRGQEQVIEPWDGRTYVLVAADGEAATYQSVARLMLEPTGIEFESQHCTSSSLRAWRAHERDVERAAELGERAPAWGGATPIFGSRICIRFDGLAVREGEFDFSWFDGSYDFHIPSQPGTVDCRVACSTEQVEEMGRVAKRMEGTWLHARDAATIPIHRTAAACHASTDTGFSGLPTDLCSALGAELP